MPTVKEYQNDPYSEYSRKVAYVESGNNPSAKNPNSSAAGKYQFVKSTFKYISDKYNLGYTEDDRFDSAKSQKAFELFTKDNESILKGVKPEINDGDRYLAHFLGAGGASELIKVYQNNPDAPISSIVSQGVINANGNVLRGKTVKDVYNWAQQKMGNSTTESITDGFTDYEVPKSIPNFVNNKVALEGLPEQSKQVEEAKQTLQQQTNEYNFLNEVLNQPELIRQHRDTVAPIQQDNTPPADIIQQYNEISNFVQVPILQEGGRFTYENELMSQVINQRNNNLNFVQRGLYPDQYPYVQNSDGSISTHRLQYSDDNQGNYYVSPTIIQDNNGNLVELNPDEASRYGAETGQEIKIPNLDLANYYSENGLIKHQQGGRVIEDNMGQWKYPGEITKINSSNITMKGVEYPMIGIADTGEKRLMRPGLEYYFKDAKNVTEYPLL